MVTFSGKSVLKGVAIGKLYIFKKQEYTMVKRSVEDVEAEVARFHGARLKGMEQLGKLYQKTLEEVGEEHAAIFEVHQYMLDDLDYIEAIEKLIRDEKVNAEYAVDMTGISSIVASATVAIGLALQGSLSNIAGWVLIIVTRPFKLGDYIKAQGEEGTVEEINLFYTHLKTPDNKQIIIPNGNLSADVMVNYSVKDIRRVEVVFDIDYKENPNMAINLIKAVIEKHPLINKDPSYFVRVSEYADSSIRIVTRVWCKNSNYWTVHYDLLEQVKKSFDENNIEVPYNKIDVNIIK